MSDAVHVLTCDLDDDCRCAAGGYNDHELERGRRIRDQIRDADICPDCHFDGRHADGCPASVASEERDA